MKKISEMSILKKMNTFNKEKNRGMTMIEVLMGFVVLMVFMGGMSSIINFSSQMLFNSMDIRKAQQKIQSELYKKTPDGAEDVEGKYKLVGTNHEGATKEIDIELNLIKIESQNIGIDEDTLQVRIYEFKKK